MLDEKLVKQIYGKHYLDHGFDHIERVHKNGMKIAKKQKNVNLKIIDAALWLHDIARPQETKTGICHAKNGAKKVVPILKKINFSKEEINEVSKAIASHRFSKGKKAESIEAQILQDADRLDALGAITVARIFTHGGHIGRSISDSVKRFEKKQLKLLPSTFNTKIGQKLAKEKYKVTKNFYEQIKKELKLNS